MAIMRFIRLPSAAASTNATSANVGSTKVHFISGLNAGAAARYLKLYDLSTAPTVGTSVIAATFALPVGAFAYDFPEGVVFQNGLAYALTTGAADNDTGALTLADVTGLNIGIA